MSLTDIWMRLFVMPFVVCVLCLWPQLDLPKICKVYFCVHKTGIIVKESPIYYQTV